MMRTLGLFGLVVLMLAVATLVVRYLRRREMGLDPVILETIRRRISAWWFLTTVIAASSICGRFVTVLLFGMLSFWSLREFITLTPTRPNDHRTLFWMFVFFTPLQFILIGFDVRWAYLIVLPMAAALYVPIRLALADDPKRFLERATKLQFAMLLCLFCLSCAPAVLMLPIPGGAAMHPGPGQTTVLQENPAITGTEPVPIDPATATELSSSPPAIPATPRKTVSLEITIPEATTAPEPATDTVEDAVEDAETGDAETTAIPNGTMETAPAAGIDTTTETAAVQTGPRPGFTLLENPAFRLLFFFILIVQLSDSLQYAWSLLPGRHLLAARISPGKTVEGLVGSVICTALTGMLLCWATPWPFWYAAIVSAGVAAIGQLGSLVMSGVKRDRGVRDYGTLVADHEGVLDRIDSLCFAAPFFYFMAWIWIR